MSDTEFNPITAPAIDLNSMLTPDEAAEWLKMTPRQLADATRSNKIPAVRFNTKTIRYHPATILSKAGCFVSKP